MRYLKWCLLLILVCPLLASADDVASGQLAQLLTNLKSLQATFAQTVYDGNGNVLQQTSGAMSLQRPGKFRWQVQSPSKQLLIADGKQVWFYDPDLSQVTVQKQQSDNKSSPAMLLSGSTQELTQNFVVAPAKVNDKSAQAFQLTPKQKSSLFQSVQLDFRSGQLRSMRLIDSLGQATVIRFTQVKNNPTLNPSLFRFVTPKGVDVVRE